MQYKLFPRSLNDAEQVVKTILINRGIKNWEQYLNLNESCCCDYQNLDNIDKAVELFDKHFSKHNPIGLIIDEDFDGYGNSAALYMYIKKLDKNYPVYYILHHNTKAHGLSQNDFDLPQDIKLLIISDAGTNDASECNALIEQGIDCLIVDHHQNEKIADENKAIIVNNQMSLKYANKDLCGGGVVYKWLSALDDYYICSYADDFLDLVAFTNIADCMDIRSPETRYYIETGLKNIHNKFLLALLDAQSFSINNIINIHNMAWYIIPICNAMIRCGSFEEKELMFKAFIEQDETFEYKKRDGSIVDEDIYTRAARLCKNAKSKQDRERDKLFEQLKDKVNPDDKIQLIVADNVSQSIIGLSCMKLCDHTKKATIVVREFEKDGVTILGGSARNYNGSPIKNFKNLVNNIEFIDMAQGHQEAFGVSLNANNIESARIALNKAAENIVFDPTIYVDFIININDIEYQFIKTIDDSKWLYGTGIEEPIIAIEGVEVCPADIAIMGKDKNAISFQSNGIKFCAFKLSYNDALLNLAQDADEDIIQLDVVGTCSLNEYQGRVTSQFIISDYNICL